MQNTQFKTSGQTISSVAEDSHRQLETKRHGAASRPSGASRPSFSRAGLLFAAALALLLFGLPQETYAPTTYTVVPGRIVGTYSLTWPSTSPLQVNWLNTLSLAQQANETVIASGGAVASSFINGDLTPPTYTGEVVNSIGSSGGFTAAGPIPNQVTATYAIDVETGPDASPPFAHLPYYVTTRTSFANGKKYFNWPPTGDEKRL